MNKLVTTAIGLAAVGPVCFADPGDGEWSGLDSEISSLASSLRPQGDGSGWTALLRTGYTLADDDITTGGGATPSEDISGFAFYDLDFAFWGSVGDIGWRASFDLFDGTTSSLQVEDAYAAWDCTPDVRTTLGQFKAPVFSTGSVDPENQLFINRSAIGSAFDEWNQGVMAAGNMEQLHWAAWLQNGSNNNESDHRYGFRLEWLLGSGFGGYEGARDKDAGLNATVGVMVLNDDTATNPGSSDTLSYGVDINGNFDQFGFGVEAFMMDDDADFYATRSTDFGPLFNSSLNFNSGTDDALAHAIMLSYALNSEMEFGFRSEALDDVDDTELLSLVLNYHKVGNNAKYSVQWTDVNTDSPALEGSWLKAGITVGGSR